MRKADDADDSQMNAPLGWVAVAFLLGIGLRTVVPGDPWLLAGATAVAAVAAAWCRHRRTASLLMLWVGLGMLRVGVWQVHPAEALSRILSPEPQAVQVHGVIGEDPVELLRSHDLPAIRSVLEARHLRTDGQWVSMQGRLLVTFHDTPRAIAYGDEVLLEGTWSTVLPPGNPRQYDWQRALARQRIHGMLRVRPHDGVVIQRRGQGARWMTALLWLRHRWEQLIQRTAAPRDAGLLAALLLGERVALDERLKAAFVETGTMHLVVVSGFNVGVVAGLLELLLRILGAPWRLRLLLVALGLGVYSVLTGAQPPVMRATLMAWVVLGAAALDRPLSWFNALAAAALVITWCVPTQLFDPGFQLSFGAVLSLLVFASRWQPRVERLCRWVPLAWLRRYLALSLSATCAVWVGLWPVLAWYFHLIAPVSVVGNLLLVPLVSLLVFVGTALLIVGSVAPIVMVWSGGMLTGILHVTLACVAWCHALPAGYWYPGRPSVPVVIGYYGLIALTLARRSLGWTGLRVAVCWLVGANLWVWSAAVGSMWQARWLRMDVIDVGHGDSLLLRLPQGQAMLIDGGSLEAGQRRVVPLLRSMGLTRLDAAVVTHPDADHLGGMIPVVERLRIARLLTNGAQDDTMSARRLITLASERGMEQHVLVRGMRLATGSSVVIEVLHPPAGFVPGTAPASNDNSLVLKLTYGQISIVLTGDVEEEGLPWLLRDPSVVRSTILKVPHHGSRLGEAGGAFFAAVRPSLAVLSVGRMHHLPASETLEAIAATGSKLLSTRDAGAISLRTDGRRLQVRTFREPRWRTVLKENSKGKRQNYKAPFTVLNVEL